MPKKKKERRFEMAHLAIGLGGILVGIFTTILTIKSSEKIAEKSGAFDKPQARLYIYNIGPRPNDNTFLCYGYSFRDSSMTIGRIPVVIENVGEKTINNLSLTFRYPNVLRRKALEKMEMITTGLFEKKQEIYKGISRIGNFDYVSYQFPSLNPGQSIGINEPIFIFETTARGLIEMDESLLAYQATYLFELAMTLSGTDIPSQDFAVSLMTIQCANISELREKFQEYVDGQARKIRDKATFWSYIALLMREKFKLALLVHPVMNTVKTDFGNILLAGEQGDEVSVSGYVPISIRYLLKR